MCEQSQLDCVKTVMGSNNPCLQSCQGLFITGIDRIEYDDKTMESILSIIKKDYDLYKAEKWFVDESLTGIKEFEHDKAYDFVDYNWKNDLKLVSVFFDTPGYDEVTKDTSAKFVDILSAIGGTFGLLTGFSIISGVEIIYFLAKFILNMTKK